MSAIILFALAVLMALAGLSLPVSPDKITFEIGALLSLCTAAFCGYCYGVPRLLERGKTTTEEARKTLAAVVPVLAIAAVVIFFMFGIASLKLTGKASTPGSRDEPNATHALVIGSSVYFAALLFTLLRWTNAGTPHDPRLARARIGVAVLFAASIVGMIGRVIQLAPRLPAFDLGDVAG